MCTTFFIRNLSLLCMCLVFANCADLADTDSGSELPGILYTITTYKGKPISEYKENSWALPLEIRFTSIPPEKYEGTVILTNEKTLKISDSRTDRTNFNALPLSAETIGFLDSEGNYPVSGVTFNIETISDSSLKGTFAPMVLPDVMGGTFYAIHER